MRVRMLLCVLPFAAACSSNGGGSDTITVNGQVRNAYGGVAAGVNVLVNGTLATTDSSGNFTVEGVTTPYDIAVYDAVADVVTGVSGATRTDPILAAPLGSNRSGTLAVTLSPASAGGESSIRLRGPYSYTSGDGNPDNFVLSASWAGDTTLPARLFATRVLTTNGQVTDVLDHGAADVTFQENVEVGATVTMSPMTTTPMSVDVTPAPGYEVSFVNGTTVVAGTTDPVLAHGLSLTVPAMYRVFASASYEQRMQTIAFPSGTSSDNGFGIAVTAVPAGTATLTLSPPARAELSAPAANAPFGTGDVVSWTSPLPSTAGYRVQLVPADGTGTSVYFYAGKVSSFTLPDLTLLGATLEAESYGLRVQGVEPHPTSDEVLTGVVEPSNGIRTLTGSVSERRTVQGAP